MEYFLIDVDTVKRSLSLPLLSSAREHGAIIASAELPGFLSMICVCLTAFDRLAPSVPGKAFCRGPTRRSQKSLVFPTPKSGAAVSIKIALGSGLA